MKTCAVIFNYNLPSETTEIYTKLLSDGFDKKDIIVVDNGSDAKLKPSCANFLLPKNTRFTGQAFLTSTLLLEYYNYDSFLYLTTSAKLVNEVNYFIEVKKCASIMKKENIGFIVASLFGGRTADSAPEQHVNCLENDFTAVYNYQPIATLISKDLLMKCKEDAAAYFNLNLKRGWGIDRELQYTANKHGMKCFTSKYFMVEWVTNLTHSKGVADESVSKYRTEAEFEMVNAMISRYGVNWSKKFKSKFDDLNGLTDKSSETTNIINYLLIKLKIFKYIKSLINKKW